MSNIGRRQGDFFYILYKVVDSAMKKYNDIFERGQRQLLHEGFTQCLISSLAIPSKQVIFRHTAAILRCYRSGDAMIFFFCFVL